MPAKKSPKLLLTIDLLKPQSNPEKVTIKLFRWLLSTGRYIFIGVEALVLIAFLFRFKLDADLQKNKEDIENKIPYIKSLQPQELLVRQVHLKLSTIDAYLLANPDYTQILKQIADQVPSTVKILNLTLEKEENKINIQINAESQNNNDLNLFLNGMRQGGYFTEVSLPSVGLQEGVIHFTLRAVAPISVKGTSL